jgi:hypothetical protein
LFGLEDTSCIYAFQKQECMEHKQFNVMHNSGDYICTVETNLKISTNHKKKFIDGE